MVEGGHVAGVLLTNCRAPPGTQSGGDLVDGQINPLCSFLAHEPFVLLLLAFLSCIIVVYCLFLIM